MPKNIAILVPSYNASSTLKTTLESLLAVKDELERHVDFVLLSDDGSKDKTVEIAQATWLGTSVPLKLKLVETNQGEYRNVNSAFASLPPHIEWVMIMHADNKALPGWADTLAAESAKAGARTASICGSWTYSMNQIITATGDRLGVEKSEDIAGDNNTVRGTLFKGCWWHNSSAIIRVAAWVDVGGHPQDTPIHSPLAILGITAINPAQKKKVRIKGDWDTLLRFLSSGWTIRYVPVPLIEYVEVNTSVSTGSFGWHGDLIETLQVIRRHQAALKWTDLVRLHFQGGITLLKRFLKSLVTLQWKRAGYAVLAAPYWPASMLASTVTCLRGTGGRTPRIPFPR